MKSTANGLVSAFLSKRKFTILPFLICSLVLFFEKSATAQCIPQSFDFTATPVLTGTAGAVNAQYRYPNVIPGVDVVFTIANIVNGAALGNIDTYTLPTAPYPAAWQPLINTNANITGDSYINWNVVFS